MKSPSQFTVQDTRQSSESRLASSEHGYDLQDACHAVGTAISKYSIKHPGAVAVAVFFAGFYVGWKVKPW